jgi:hypothetical protein
MIEPNKAGMRLLNAGCIYGLLNSGSIRGARNNIPKKTIITVTIDEAEMAIIDSTSPFSVPGSHPATSIAFRAAGILRLLTFPVKQPL